MSLLQKSNLPYSEVRTLCHFRLGETGIYTYILPQLLFCYSVKCHLFRVTFPLGGVYRSRTCQPSYDDYRFRDGLAY